MLTLPVEKRDGTDTPASLRKSGLIPAVVYGAHQTSTPISVDAKAFAKVLKEAGEATIVSLSGLGAALPTLIHEIDRDPVKGYTRHVDFYAVTKGEKVEVAIPLTFIGESAAAAAGANIVKVAHEIEVKADPMNLPSDIEVNLSLLKAVDDRIYAKDLKLPAGIELITEADEVIVLAQEVVEEKVEEVAAAADIASIEVEKKGKEGEAASAEEK